MGRVVDMPLPRLGETMEEGRIGQYFKQPGERFRRGETLLEVETDKTTVEVPALQDGVLIEWLVKVDDIIPVEIAIARIEVEGEALAEVKKPNPKQIPAFRSLRSSVATQRRPFTRPRASTAARAAARKSGIDLATVEGWGRNGRVTRADLVQKSGRTSYHAETPYGQFFIREWPAKGPPKGAALLIHGLFSDSQSFVTLGRMLGSVGLRTLAIDLPGHGETRANATTVADIAAAISAALPAGKLHIAGHSFGAVVAAHLLDRALSLTLLSPIGTGEEINGDFIAAMLGGRIDEALNYFGEKLPPGARTGLAQHLSTNASQLRAIAGAVADGNRQTVSILAQLAALTVPVNAVYLRGDAIVPSQHALNLPANVAVHLLPGSGHLPHWRNPGLVAHLVASQL